MYRIISKLSRKHVASALTLEQVIMARTERRLVAAEDMRHAAHVAWLKGKG